jgi:UDP-glucose 4-epimerase
VEELKIRALICGGAGFIGSNLVKALIENGDKVIVLDDFSVGKLSNLDILAPYDPKSNDKLTVVTGSILDLNLLYSLAMQVDIIYHLAVQCLVKCNEDFKLGHEVNDTGTFNVCLAAMKFKAKLVYISSSEIYGTAKVCPMPESHPTDPQSIYGLTKLVGEKWVSIFNKYFDVPAVIIRPFNCYGENHRGDQYAAVLTNFIKRALQHKPLIIHGNGEQSRDLTYVGDTVQGIILLSKLSHGEIVNIGSGSSATIHDLARIISTIAGEPLNFIYEDARVNDVFKLEADITLAKTYGYSPKMPLREGLKLYFEWYKKHGEY